MKLTSEDSANKYALAPAECAPACSAEDIARLEKEKSHSFELVLALSLLLQNSEMLPQNREGSHFFWTVQDYFNINLFACQYLPEKKTSPHRKLVRYSFRVNYHLAFIGLFNCMVRKLGNVFAQLYIVLGRMYLLAVNSTICICGIVNMVGLDNRMIMLSAVFLAVVDISDVRDTETLQIPPYSLSASVLGSLAESLIGKRQSEKQAIATIQH